MGSQTIYHLFGCRESKFLTFSLVSWQPNPVLNFSEVDLVLVSSEIWDLYLRWWALSVRVSK
uniref:Uncharacterized protein n=1 Tax=Rhizophora mucronata TaxID=61149 RepID=A0A2P2MUM4_RHIMU